MNKISERLESLRGIMRARGLSAYIVTSGDAHAGEYIADYWAARRWLTGFTGSAGIAVITLESAGLFTDSRYWIQAAGQLAGSGFTLFKQGEPSTQKYHDYAVENTPAGGKIGFDGRTVTVSSYELLKKAADKKNISFSLDDIIGEIWADRPALPTGVAFAHAAEYAGETTASKLTRIREKMQEKSMPAYILPALDNVAWLMNMRGSDVQYLPVANAYACVLLETAHLFIDAAKVAPLADTLQANGITIHAYDALPAFLAGLAVPVHFSPAITNVLLYQAIKQPVKIPIGQGIIGLLQAAKTPHELANIRNAFIAEGVAMVKTLRYIYEGNAKTEDDIDRHLQAMRAENPLYVTDAFSTIAAYGENAAQAHYRHTGQGATIEKKGFLLIDTGGQYLNGTTDTTRTLFMGTTGDDALDNEMKLAYTLVLKGMIALSNANFPQGTTGIQLDVLARAPMWVYGRNFKHGTGHGIGYCLSVHEGPQSISPYPSSVQLAPGMLLSNEPALYRDGFYGIRTENVITVSEFQKTDDGTFLWFETLTVCPIDTQAIDLALLTPFESLWLDTYHKYVFDTLSPLLPDEADVRWLKEATKPLPLF
jgi:Xaa-Pro aminopeptidase